MGSSGVGFNLDYQASFGRFSKAIKTLITDAEVMRICYEAMEVAYARACQLCPIDSRVYTDSQGNSHPGHLLRSLKKELTTDAKGNVTISLSNEARYAGYNEFGWCGIPPVPEPPEFVFYKGGYRPFMRIGIIDGLKYIEREIKKVIRSKVM